MDITEVARKFDEALAMAPDVARRLLAPILIRAVEFVTREGEAKLGDLQQQIRCVARLTVENGQDNCSKHITLLWCIVTGVSQWCSLV